MTIWEKAILSMQRGAQRLSMSAAILSERVKCEIAIIRLRIKIDEVQSRMDEQYRLIGRRVVNLKNGEALPITTEQLVKDTEIEAAMAEIETCKKDKEDLQNEIVSSQAMYTPAEKQGPTL